MGLKPKKCPWKNLSALSEETGATHVVINLGDNMFDWRRFGGISLGSVRGKEFIKNEVNQLLKSMKAGQECTWIGPVYHNPGRVYRKPNSEVDKLYEALDEALDGKCRLIDSRPAFTSTSPNDGLHLTDSESAEWGAFLADKI